MSTIEREVHIEASPAEVAAALGASSWHSAIDIRPEGAGARVRIRASASPPPVADALEMAILDEVCAAKRLLEQRPSGPSRGHMVGKSM